MLDPVILADYLARMQYVLDRFATDGPATAPLLVELGRLLRLTEHLVVQDLSPEEHHLHLRQTTALRDRTFFGPPLAFPLSPGAGLAITVAP